MYIPLPEQQELGELGWVVKNRINPHPGHEVLTRMAANGLGLTGRELETLIEGVRRPDTESTWFHVFPTQMKRHFLRYNFLQDYRAAWADAVNQLRNLHRQILFFRYNPNNPGEQFRLIGETLHLIQDSYSSAHVERDRGTGRILYIRKFGPEYPLPRKDEHGFPYDKRDQIHQENGALRPEAQQAIKVSREYLQMVLRHIKRPQSAPPIYLYQELEAFVCRNFSLTNERCPTFVPQPKPGPQRGPRPATTPTPGQYYQIKRGDTLWAIAGKAYGGKTGSERLAFVKMINNHSYNRKFWRVAPPAERKWFPSGRISFNPIFACDPNAQLGAKAKAPAGRCYAMIYIPRR